MTRAYFIIGTAGSGKTTFTNTLRKIFTKSKFINLDPATIHYDNTEINTKTNSTDYEYYFDIRDVFDYKTMLETSRKGPNTILLDTYKIFYNSVEFDQLINNQIEDDDESEDINKHNLQHLFFDCPGQIELYMRNDDFSNVLKSMENKNIKIQVIYLIDGNLMNINKYLTNSVVETIIRMKYWYPFISVLTKMDLYVKQCMTDNKKNIETIVDELHISDPNQIAERDDLDYINEEIQTCYEKYDNFSMVPFVDRSKLNTTEKTIYEFIEYNDFGYYLIDCRDEDMVENIINMFQ